MIKETNESFSILAEEAGRIMKYLYLCQNSTHISPDSTRFRRDKARKFRLVRSWILKSEINRSS